jgi:hypothetical protein
MGYGNRAFLGLGILASLAAHATTPCDFKGLSVGDKATPQQIMKHFGVDKFLDADATQAKNKADFDSNLKRAETVGLMNASEEADWHMGPACGYNYCRIPYGVSVGSGAFPIPVGVFVSFDKAGTIEAIDVSYSYSQWNDVLELLNTKYGDNWRSEVTNEVVTNLETKKSEQLSMTEILHRTPGTNPKTGDKCTLHATSLDLVFTHSMAPLYRASLEIKLVSKNF